jgi:sulfur-carrier protein
MMAVTVLVPTPLQRLTNGDAEVRAEASSVGELVNNLEAQYPGIKERLCDEQGRLRRFVNVYVNNEDIRFQQNEETPLNEGDEVSIIPAIAGGR